MKMTFRYRFLILLMSLVYNNPLVMTQCLQGHDTCEFWLEIDYRLTMNINRTGLFPKNGKLYTIVEEGQTSQEVPIEKVITADGWKNSRLVIAVNGSMPGPPLEVFQGQNIIVHVKNMLLSEAVTVHWHGLHQIRSPWMDGVGFITQCPILPGQEFTYKFKAYPKGTFWYHSHVGTQLSMGLVGAFIIKEKEPDKESFIMMLQDWNHDFDSNLSHEKMLMGNYVDGKRIKETTSLEGGIFSMFQFQSGLINGRGRYYYPSNYSSNYPSNSPYGVHNQAPLTKYNVTFNQTYRFHVIGAGNLYPFRLSIDDHPLTLVASDGYDLQPVVVESIIINPGERYDFFITTNQSVRNYWVRAVTLEVNVTHVAEAILSYSGSPEGDLSSVRRNCTLISRCLVVNCPFSHYPTNENIDCIHIGQLNATTDQDVPGEGGGVEIEDLFFNFGFPGPQQTTSINGRRFMFPHVSALTQPEEISTICDDDQCGEDKVCHCSYSVTLQYNKIYQMVLTNMGNGKGWAHPIHMHGHSFHVVKMGYPTYDQTTGMFLKENLDIDCRGNPDREKSYCNDATWANKSWGGNNVPGLNLGFTPRKDTIIIPTGGYVVLRIKADNPGVWLMHCHIELHSMDGMILMFNESFARQPTAPSDLFKCGDFFYKSRISNPNGFCTMGGKLQWIVFSSIFVTLVF
ncbi:unnamed protein product [Lymnaea stagnalis]|uniref:Laccase n=1 Tax=Lymnaea stagnalis TaxID=6523 RepID=A0AAV2H4A0_LYMST